MVKPETVGLSSSRLAKLDEVMAARYVDGGFLPGILTQVYRKGHLVHTGMAGHMDLERQKAMREDAIFRIYSMSKPITAVALMMLVEEGALGLDDLVHHHIPSWKRMGVYASGMPTLLADQPPQFITTPTERAMKAFEACFDRGVMVRTTGYIIAMSPPLIIEEAQIDRLVETIRDALARID